MTGSLLAYEHWVASYRRAVARQHRLEHPQPGSLSRRRSVSGSASSSTTAPIRSASRTSTYVAPGMLVAAGMQHRSVREHVAGDGRDPWTRVYHAMLATPLRVRDVMVGHQLYVASRVATLDRSLPHRARGVRHAAFAVRDRSRGRSPILVGLAFSAPLAALRGMGAEGQLSRRGLPLRRRPVVPLLRDVLPRHAAAAGPARACVRDSAVARRRSRAPSDARHGDVGYGARTRRISRRVHRRRAVASPNAPTRESSCGDDLRRHSRPSALRAQPHGVPPLVADHLQRALRAALLSRLARLRARATSSAACKACRTRATSRRRCSRRRR